MTSWFRSWHGAPTDPKWLAIAQRTQTNAGMVSAVFWALMDHASQADDRGDVSGFDVEAYAAFSGFDAAQIGFIIGALESKNIIQDNKLTAWEKRQPKREDGSAERAKKWRERKRTQTNAPERHRVDTDTDTDTERKKEGANAPPTKSSKKDRKRAHPLPADFQPDWSAATAAGLSRNEAEREFLKFKNHAEANGRTCVSWSAAWRNWCISAAGFLKKPLKPTGPPTAMTINPKSRSWNMWKAYYRDNNMNGQASLMERCAYEDRLFTVVSEWPPGFEVTNAA